MFSWFQCGTFNALTSVMMTYLYGAHAIDWFVLVCVALLVLALKEW